MYVQVSAGDGHTVLLLSDGSAIACGAPHRCKLPDLRTWSEIIGFQAPRRRYVPDAGQSWVEPQPDRVLQLSFLSTGSGEDVRTLCMNVAGEEVHSSTASLSDDAGEVRGRLESELRASAHGGRLHFVLPNMRLFGSVDRSTPVASLIDNRVDFDAGI